MIMTRIDTRWFLLAFGGVLVACGTDTTTPRTQVMVVIDAESEVRKLAPDIDLEVRTGTGPVSSWDVREQTSLTPGKGIKWPLEAALVPRDNDANRVYLVTAIARDAQGKAIAEVRAISGYQPGKTVMLLLVFENACLDKATSCSLTQTCRSGDCVDAHVNATLLPGYGSGGALDSGASGSAGTGGNDAGHKNAGGSDAGHKDASVSDAGVDASGAKADAQVALCKSNADCDDGDPCTGTETCGNGACKAGKVVVCGDSGDLCRPNVCTNVGGKSHCGMQDAKDGVACKTGDSSSTSQAKCSRDYQCVSGQCTAKTVDSCTATQCETAAGCDPTKGCVFTPLGVAMTCDDADACTTGDHCSGTNGTCVGTPKDCADTVGCTVDACDATGTCTHTPSDALCSGPCKTGTCDATNDCLNVTKAQDFSDCNDSNASTTPDLCYQGECLGGRQGAPGGSCQLGGCACTGFGNVRDLQYSSPKFVALIETAQHGGGSTCATGTVSSVYDVTLSALTAYASSDTANGGISESASDLDLPYVITSTHVALADTTAQSVQWTGTGYGAAIASQTPTIANFRGSARHGTGSFAATRNSYFWLWGTDSGTPSTARIVRCVSCSSNVVGGCTITGVTCSDVMSNASSSFAGVLPYNGSGFASPYGGVLALANYSSGSVRKRIYEDGTGKDMVPSSIEADDADGAWSGMIHLSGVGQVLAFGSGSNGLRLCSDASATGDTTCVALTGLPNQSVRTYSRADTNGTAVLLLASSSTNNYLVMLPSGLAPTTGSNWREISISNSASTTANAVAMGPTSFMVLGKASGVPYVWYWGPP